MGKVTFKNRGICPMGMCSEILFIAAIFNEGNEIGEVCELLKPTIDIFEGELIWAISKGEVGRRYSISINLLILKGILEKSFDNYLLNYYPHIMDQVLHTKVHTIINLQISRDCLELKTNCNTGFFGDFTSKFCFPLKDSVLYNIGSRMENVNNYHHQRRALYEDIKFIEVQRKGIGSMGSSSNKSHLYKIP
ncbi:hypothetical protein A3Q56_01813 [Intoshia linei]|uniref:Uncharacterized protein n=1 Tax=Intoshia linei TaxID=1819745 RepID=A0A177B875_9BILA|nr:hypothetical protein A3Q56_01813 [Intoshia linei]